MKKVVIALVVSTALARLTYAQLAPASSHAPTKLSVTKKAPTPDSGKVVARVNGTELKEADLRRAMNRLFPYEGMHGNKVPEKYADDIRKRALDQIVFEELLYQEAQRRGLTAPQSMIKEVEQQARSRFSTEMEYDTVLREGYGSLEGFERQVRRGILIAKIVDSDITQKAHFSDARLREFYEKNKARYAKPESISIQSITVNIPDNPTQQQLEAARKRAQEILPKAKAAKNYEEFGMLAEKLSDDDWRVMMGDHKWIHRGRIPAAVENVAFSMKPQQVSDVIETKEALIIVRVNSYEPQKQMSFEEVKGSMREGLEQAASEKLRADLEQRLNKNAKVEVM